MTISMLKDVKKIPIGSRLIIVERFGQPYLERLILKKHTTTGFIAAPHNNLNQEKAFRCDSKSFVPSEAGFSLKSPLGRMAVRFEVQPQ